MLRKEETCFSQCMSKYMDTWNAVATVYAKRSGQEAMQRGAGMGDLGGV